MAAGAMEPNRVRTLWGARNACSIGYCWSSIIPTSSANGLSVSTWSASASPVMWMAMVVILTHAWARTHRPPALGLPRGDDLELPRRGGRIDVAAGQDGPDEQRVLARLQLPGGELERARARL